MSTARINNLDGSVTLNNCETEPIHTPGSVQSFAYLLVCRPEDYKILQASDSCAHWFNDIREPQLQVLLSDDNFATLCLELKSGTLESAVTSIGIEKVGDETLDLLAHTYDGNLIVEFQKRVSLDDQILVSFNGLLQSLAEQPTTESFLHTLADGVRELTGIDRVMIYQFLEDWSGDVRIESMREGLKDSFQGLRFPAYDVPKPARDVFQKVNYRIIPHAASPQQLLKALLPDGENLNPDLTFAVSRGVSPMHVEYLDNMGVTGTLSIPLKEGRKLWGLVACHNYQPYELSPRTLAGLEILGQLTSSHLTRLLIEGRVELTDQHRESVREAVQVFDPLDVKDKAIDALAALVPADGFAYFSPGTIWSRGAWLNNSQLLACIDVVRALEFEKQSYATDGLQMLLPTCARWEPPAAGAYCLFLDEERDYGFLWLRAETEQEVKWGGKPDCKIVKVGPSGARLHPRSSFEEYVESVSGKARPWARAERATLQLLRDTLLENAQRRAHQLSVMNRELVNSNEELDTFAHVTSHDLKEPLRGIHNYAVFLLEDYAELLDAQGNHMLKRIEHLSVRMDGLLDSLLGLAKMSRHDVSKVPISLDAIVIDVEMSLARVIEASGARIKKENLSIDCVSNAVLLGQIIMNLVSNAIKYGGPNPEITVSAHSDAEYVLIEVEDKGIGIEPENLAKIFELFVKLDLSDSDTAGGFGLGLHIVKSLTSRLGGEVSVKSQPGKGSVFTITLPQPKREDSRSAAVVSAEK